MKTQQELEALKEEVRTLNGKLAELSEEELAQVTGGAVVRRADVHGRQVVAVVRRADVQGGLSAAVAVEVAQLAPFDVEGER